MKSFIRQHKIKIPIILILIFLVITSTIYINLFKYRTLGEKLVIKDEIYYMLVYIIPPKKDTDEYRIPPVQPYEYPFAWYHQNEMFVLSHEIGESLLNKLLNTKVQRKFFHKTIDSFETDRLQIILFRDIDSLNSDDNFNYINISIESSQYMQVFPFAMKEGEHFYNLKVHEDDADIIQVLIELLN